MSTSEKQLEAIPETVKQALLLLAIFQELFRTLLSLFRGNLSIQDVHTRLLSLHSDAICPQNEESGDSSASLPTDYQSSETGSSSRTSESSDGVPGVFSGIRVLCRAIVQRDTEKVSDLLKSRPTLVRKRHEGGWYPLHTAVLSGDIELVKKFLACSRVDVNVKYDHKYSFDEEERVREFGPDVSDTDDATPLHYAAMTGNIDIIRALVEHGADFKAKDHNGRKPIDYFKSEEHTTALESYGILYEDWKLKDGFFRGYTSFDDLVKLMWKDRFDLFDRVIKKKPKLASMTACTRITLLHMAVILQRQDFVEFLITTRRSLVNKCDKRRPGSGMFHGPTIFCCGPCRSTEELCIPFLPPTVPYDHVRKATPLHYACLVKNVEIARMLLEAGADWTEKDSQGRTPLELIQEVSESDNEFRDAFVRLQEAEEERRKLSGGECPNDTDSSSAMPEGGSGSNSDNEEKKSTAGLSPESLLGFEEKIGEKIVGQRGPIHMLGNAIRLRQGGWIDPDRPLTMLFLGSSGVGKTEVAKQLALYLNGKDGLAIDKGKSVTDLEKDYSFVRLDMSEYQERHTVHNLIGAPKSYVGYGEGGALTQPLKKNPRAIVLLDEIEKAHPDVLNTFLQVFDDGRVADSKDGVIHCKDAIFIMTSNIAGEEIKRSAPWLRQSAERSEKEGRYESYVHTMQDFTRTLRPQLKDHLKRDEFIGRINEIAVFLPLSPEEIQLVVQRELEMWCKRAQEKHKVNLTWTNEVVRKLASAYNVDYGVRSVASEVQRIALRVVAEAHIKGRILENCTAGLELNEVGDIKLKEYARIENSAVISSPAKEEGMDNHFESFVGLCKQIVVTLPLSEEEIKLAVQGELVLWRGRAEENHKINLTWSDEVVQKIASSYNVDEGVSSIADEVQRLASQLTADMRISDNCTVELKVDDIDDIVMEVRPPV